MNLLDRHIFKSVLFSCLAAIALFTFVLVLGNVVKDLLSHALAGHFPFTTFVRLIALWIPSMAVYALPMGILTGVLLTLGRLSADSEITAMRAAGISLGRLAWPVCVLGALCAAAALFVNFNGKPWARLQYEREKAAAVRSDPLSFIVPKTYIRDFKGRVIYVGDRQGNVLHDVWLWELDSQRQVKRVVRAESGRLFYDEATNSLVPTFVRMKIEERDEAHPEDFTKSPKAPSFHKAEEVRISLDRYLSQDTLRLKEDWLTYEQLRAEHARLGAELAKPEQERDRARAQMKIKLVIQERYTLALAVFSFALIGVPLGIKVSRRETSANLGVALLLVLSYYTLTVMVKWLDRQPELRPDLLIWLPNLAFIGLAFWLFRRVDRR